MREIIIEVTDKTFDRLKEIKSASGFITWRRFFIGCVRIACFHDKRIIRERGWQSAGDRLAMFEESGREDHEGDI